MVEIEKPFKFPKTLIIVYITVFVNTFGYSFIMPILPFFTEYLNGTPFELGIVLSIYALMQAFSCVIMGTLSDKYGRSLFIILSLFGSFSGPLLQSFSMNMLWFIIARGYTGMLGGSSTIAQAYIADIIPIKYRANYLSHVGALVSTSFVVGPALGGLLGEISYQLPFWVASLCAFFLFISSFFLLTETNQSVIKRRALNKEKRTILKKTGLNEEDSKRLEEIKNEFETIKQEDAKKKKVSNEKVHWNPLMVISLLLRLFNDGANVIFDSALLLYIKDVFGSSSLNNSILIVVTSVVCAIIPIFLFPFLHDKCKIPLSYIILGAAIIEFIGAILEATVPYLWFYYVSCVIFYIGYAILNPAPSIILSAQTNPDHQGNVLSIGVLATQISFICVPLIATYVYEHSKFQAIMLTIYQSFVVLICAIVLFFLPGSKTCEISTYQDITELNDKDIELQKKEGDNLQIDISNKNLNNDMKPFSNDISTISVDDNIQTYHT